MSMKNSNDIIGNRTRDLPACSAVPHPTAPPGAQTLKYLLLPSILSILTKKCIYLLIYLFIYGLFNDISSSQAIIYGVLDSRNLSRVSTTRLGKYTF
jgi:hypothetical protein